MTDNHNNSAIPATSTCGSVHLLAKILEVDVNPLLQRYGLPMQPSIRILVACDQCGKLHPRRIKELIWRVSHAQSSNGKPVEHFFCSALCRNTWRGIHYGFRAHPEHAGRNSRKRDWQLVWDAHKRFGEGESLLSRRLGIPRSTIGRILRKMREQQHL